ncbi:YraN family protein [Tepidimonas charontis]|uniref:UPF0102 protein Tchar_02388 n=1 Tax=Tepidimonas charontis TaxID=2267262 RepID=A0A554X4N0_9BURK|nr:YraN family protein [Tepidimonas charontis]TSE30794.1 hypothetical protein Tchar_02388 [Tepidimonas charontis]
MKQQPTKRATQGSTRTTPRAAPSTRVRGSTAETLALQYLQAHGLGLVARNVRSPGRGGGEVDLIMTEPDGTLVFVEVRQRSSAMHGGAAASIGWVKQRRIVFAARHFLARLRKTPPCRFDAVLVDGELDGRQPPRIHWIRAAFDAAAWD